MAIQSNEEKYRKKLEDRAEIGYLDIVLQPDGALTIYVRSEGDFLPLILQELKETGVQVHVRFRSPCG